MEKEQLVLQQTLSFVQKDFELNPFPEGITAAELLAFLEQFVQELIDHNLERLFYVLYRLDINEQKVHQALAPTAKDLPHKVLAQLIFQREYQKAQTRIAYAEKNKDVGDGWND